MPKKPFYRAFDDWWYVEVGPRGNRTQIKLVKGKKNETKAYRRFVEVVGSDAIAAIASKLTVAEACDNFLDWSQRNHQPLTYRQYRDFLQDFCNRYGSLKVMALKPFHVTQWVQKHTWNSTSQNKAIGCLKRCLNFVASEGLAPDNPLRLVRKPRALRRETILSSDDRKRIMAAIRDRAFKMFVFALSQTGARPSEIRTVTAAECDLNLGIWVFRKHKTVHHTGRPRIVYLTPPMIKLCRRLVREHPEGPLFRNTRGELFSRNSIICRFSRLREKLGLARGVVAYCYRHTWITEAIMRVDVATVAELAGHASLAMIEKHYGHLNQKVHHLRDAMQRATRSA